MDTAHAHQFTHADHAAEIESERPSLTLIVGGQLFRRQLTEQAPRLKSRALSLCRNAAEAQDLVQDTIVRALKFESHFANSTNMLAWLNQILFSVFVTKVRRRARERRAHDFLRHDPCAWFRRDPLPMMRKLSPRVQAAIEQLPVAFAQTLLLVDVAESGYKEAASELGVPIGTVMSRLHRARRMMRESLAVA